MTAQHDPDAVATYAAAVRAAVADLGAEERAQLLDDLEAHLQEVAAESGAPLSERLGPPEAYAAELRAAYGAPPRAGGGPAAPAGRRRWRRWRLPVGIVALAAVLIGVAVVWQVSHSGGSAPTGAPWSQARLESEAATGNVTRLVIQGRTGTATDRGGVQHAVNLPDTTQGLAALMVRDNVEVAYVQASSGTFHVGFLVAELLFLGVPLVFAAVLAVLGLGVLWRLYRRLGRPTGIM